MQITVIRMVVRSHSIMWQMPSSRIILSKIKLASSPDTVTEPFFAVFQSTAVRVKGDSRDAANELDDIVDHYNATKEAVSAVLNFGRVGWFEIEIPGRNRLQDYWLLGVLLGFLACGVDFVFMFCT